MEPIKPSDILSLPPLPISVVQLSKMVADPTVDIKAYKKVIEMDPVLTASVLRWANSSWSQSQVAITTVEQAATRLGADNILQLALGVHMMATMRKLLGKIDLSENQLWRHSMVTALATRVITSYLKWDIPGGAFSAAVIHDIGKILIARHLTFDETNNLIDKTAQEEGYTYLEAEEKVMRTNHVKLGIDIAMHWKLPDDLVETIAHHHEFTEKNTPILKTVQLANALVTRIGLSAGTTQKDQQEQERFINLLNINPLLQTTLREEIQSTFQKAVEENGLF